MAQGYLAIVLHAHLPFVRHPEHEESLEESWLFEAITEVYVPFLLVMEGLVEDGVDFRLTFSLTPTLAAMFQDPFLQSRYMKRIDRLIDLAEHEIGRTRSQPEFQKLARLYHRRFREIRGAFINGYERNLARGFKRFQDLGKVEIIASSATHGFLPLLSVNPSAVQTQVRIGVKHYETVLGRKPEGFWLPECGYYPGLDSVLQENGIRYFILETHGVTRAEPRPRYGVHAPIHTPAGVAAFGRDPDSSKQVWSSVEGYPGDFDYREFYRDIAYDLDPHYLRPYIHPDGIRIDTGIKYYRVTGKTDRKEVYVPDRAETKARMHADNFILNRQKQIEHLASMMDRKPIVVAPYDAELFGHWWYEGPMWLDYLIRRIALNQEEIRLVTLSEYLAEHPVNQVAKPAISTWGYKGYSEVWINGSNDWIYRHLHRAADAMEKLDADYPRPDGLRRRALSQARRELLLAQASDWAFMMATGSTVNYASNRTRTHLVRFNNLHDQIRHDAIDERELSNIESQDNIFPGSLLDSFAGSPVTSRESDG